MMQMTQPRAEVSETIVAHYSELAFRALLAEVNLTPKPGLVDRNNCGAHKDMALEDFQQSAAAIRPYFPRFIQLGASTATLPECEVLQNLRPIGIACEAAMFRATEGVNTHKGSIFSLGLLCAAIGRLHQQQRAITPMAICQTVAAFCHGITERELHHNNHQQTAGQRLFRQLGLTGARGEAEAGYPLVINMALPHYHALLTQATDPELALLDTLLLLMAHNGDTNVASRGGMAGLSWLQEYARTLLANGGIRKPADLRHLQEFDHACIARNLSPGGSADLLIITWLLAQISQYHP
ncbi:triphosphoribosyl-dephospho-CoA synthase [Buttiauxella sp. JUb87]|jgi:triphosphoribosyl-dephospho-CoA synthase|nr:triphosphoribosyl-dephospho-CoA synthase [Buttiauxella sp. JUb87]